MDNQSSLRQRRGSKYYSESCGQIDSDSSDEESKSMRKSQSQTAEETNLKRFTGIVRKLKDLKKPNSKEDKEQLRQSVEEQLETYNSSTSSQMATGRNNILHIIVQQANQPTKNGLSNLQPFIEAVTKQHPSLLEETNHKSMTPLHLAIKESSGRIVKYLTDALGTTLDSVLGMKDEEGNNCLHLAVLQAHKKSTIVTDLIPKVQSSAVYCALNNKNLTPMHLAVEYERCSSKLLDVVRLMILHWDCVESSRESEERALDVHVLGEYHRNLDNRSVYRYHQYTHKQAQEQAKEQIESGGGKGRKVSKQATASASNGSKSENVESDIKRSQDQRRFDLVVSQPARPTKDNTTAEPNRGKARSTLDNDSASKPVLPAAIQSSRQGSVGDFKDQGKNKYSDSAKANAALFEKDVVLNTRADGSENARSISQPDAARQIGDMLKMHYMCTRRNHRHISQFLYEPNEVHQSISVIFPPSRPPLTLRRLRQMTYARLDSVLHYVEVPQVITKSRELTGQNNSEDCIGRNDNEVIFKWLRDQNVKQIITLRVFDMVHPSHSCESIERALRYFKIVKALDWEKLDMDSESLVKIAPNVQELVLYWSGNNSVLRGWSEPEGLNKLRYLKRISIHASVGLETRSRTAAYLEEFRRRLENLWVKRNLASNQKRLGQPVNDTGKFISTTKDMDETQSTIEISWDLKDIIPDADDVHSSIALTETNMKTIGDWYECMRQFNEYAGSTLREEAGTRSVVVALIDDGVDYDDEAVSRMVIDGRSYYQRQEKLQVEPYWTSTGGHGTDMAGMIRLVCPMAKLFVVRLDEYNSSDGKRQIYAGSAAMAVRDAILKKVDIISMSWTIERGRSNHADISNLESALRDAESAGILIFCAASDQGVAANRSFLGRSSPGIKIGAAKPTGTAADYVGSETNYVDYLLPGQYERRPGRINIAPTAPTGSSVATAFASGLAALIIVCVQFAANTAMRGEQYTGKGPDREKAEKMNQALKMFKTQDGMKEAFEQFWPTKTSNSSYINVAKVFGGVGIKTEKYFQEEIYKRLHEIAEKLILKKQIE